MKNECQRLFIIHSCQISRNFQTMSEFHYGVIQFSGYQTSLNLISLHITEIKGRLNRSNFEFMKKSGREWNFWISFDELINLQLKVDFR